MTPDQRRDAAKIRSIKDEILRLCDDQELSVISAALTEVVAKICEGQTVAVQRKFLAIFVKASRWHMNNLRKE